MKHGSSSSVFKPLFQFAVHGIVGTLIFFVILIPPLVISYVVSRLLPDWAPDWLRVGLQGLEAYLFGVDAWLFVAFIWKAAIQFLKELKDER